MGCFEGPHAAIHFSPSYLTDTSTRYGWMWKLVWEVGPHYTGPVTLRGGNLRTGIPLWFAFDQGPTIAPVLVHPDHPVSALGGNWGEWGSYLSIPVAGCYYLQATWPGGHWRITFAAGRCARVKPNGACA
jgi:hypothetical protein